MRLFSGLILLMLFGCRGGGSPVADATPEIGGIGNVQTIPPIDHRVAGTWTQKEGGIVWRAIVIAPRTPHADLMRLARHLHAQEPRVFFDIYDDDAELPKLVAASGNDDALSKTWREAHAIGTLTAEVREVDGKVMLANFQLVEWATLETTKLP